MEYPHEFSISGKQFRGKFLPPDTSLDCFALIAPSLASVFDAIDFAKVKAEGPEAVFGSAIAAVLGSLKEAKKMAPQLLDAYQVEFDGKWVSLKLFKDQTFEGRPDIMVAWLIAAIKSEYRDFLRSSGMSTLQDLARVCGFQITSRATGPSGGSSLESTQP